MNQVPNSEAFQDLSYTLHREHYKDRASLEGLHNALHPALSDQWRQARMYATIAPLLKNDPTASWVMVGDGHFGMDAINLKKLAPGIKVLPTDISPYLLEIARDEKVIENFGVENAEHLSFADNAFDYSLCKNSYHHFPRPMIALYEMLRVSRKAVVLIEPNDWLPKAPLAFLKDGMLKLVKGLMGKKHLADSDHIRFETSGNYIYSISKREIQKVAMGLNLWNVAFMTWNDTYIEADRNEKDKPAHLETIKRKISALDMICKLGFKNPAILTAIIFKVPLSETEKTSLRQAGMEVVDLPENPYSPRGN